MFCLKFLNQVLMFSCFHSAWHVGNIFKRFTKDIRNKRGKHRVQPSHPLRQSYGVSHDTPQCLSNG